MLATSTDRYRLRYTIRIACSAGRVVDKSPGANDCKQRRQPAAIAKATQRHVQVMPLILIGIIIHYKHAAMIVLFSSLGPFVACLVPKLNKLCPATGTMIAVCTHKFVTKSPNPRGFSVRQKGFDARIVTNVPTI
jgi:hypothetical protein